MNNPLVTVIIPCYNSENYIKKCIESLLEQSYSQLEILVVDDASTDASATVIRELSKKDERVRFVSLGEKRMGPGLIRKKAVSLSKGSFICFLDADDYVETSFIETMMASQKLHDADVVCCGFIEEYEKKMMARRYVEAKYFPVASDFSNMLQMMECLFFNGAVGSYMWNKMFRADLLKANLELLSEQTYFEDMACVYRIILGCESVEMVDEPLYHYVRRKQTGLMQNWGEECALTYRLTAQKVAAGLVEVDERFRPLAERICLDAAVRNYKALCKNKKKTDEIRRQMKDARQYLKLHLNQIKEFDKQSEKMHAYMVIYCPVLIVAAVNIKKLILKQ